MLYNKGVFALLVTYDKIVIDIETKQNLLTVVTSKLQIARIGCFSKPSNGLFSNTKYTYSHTG